MLENLLRERGGVPKWSRVLFAEITPGHSRPLIARDKLIALYHYQDRFSELLNQGYDWINLSAAGVLDDALVVKVELPIKAVGVPCEMVSVNFSGPPLSADGKPLWYLKDII